MNSSYYRHYRREGVILPINLSRVHMSLCVNNLKVFVIAIGSYVEGNNEFCKQ